MDKTKIAAALAAIGAALVAASQLFGAPPPASDCGECPEVTVKCEGPAPIPAE